MTRRQVTRRSLRRPRRKWNSFDPHRALRLESLERRLLLAGGFNIDGDVLGTGGEEVDASFFADPSGNSTELGAVNANYNKVGNIHSHVSTTDNPTLGYESINPGNDLSGVWLDTNVDANGDVWLYFAFQRFSGSTGQVAFEFQQAATPPVNGGAVDYDSLDLTDPPGADSYTQSVIDSWNPWGNRQAGDFMVVFDTQGQNLNVVLREFNGSGFDTTTLDASVSAAMFSDDNLTGEGAINLSETVFPEEPTSCFSVANIIPATVTGNSDSADFKDVVLGDFASSIAISNCGSVRVTKVTDPVGATGNFDIKLSQSDAGEINFEGDSFLNGTLVGDGSVVTFSDLRADDDYKWEEFNRPPGWTIENIAVLGQDTDYDPATETFTVAAGVTTEITITNDGVDPQIAIEKVTVAGTAEGDGLTILSGESIGWKYTVTNVGNVPLSNVMVGDSETGVTPVLDASASTGEEDGVLDLEDTWVYTADGTAIIGDYSNTGTANGSYNDLSGQTRSAMASDDSNYFGVTTAIDVEKKVSVDEGETFVDADTTPGPTLLASGADPQYQFIVTNNSNVELTINLEDVGLDIDQDVVLAANGGTTTVTASDSWAAGQNTNTADVSASFTDDGGNTATPSDTDDANFFGADPSIDVEKEVSVDGGTTWSDQGALQPGDTAIFAITLSNTGNVTLDDVYFADLLPNVESSLTWQSSVAGLVTIGTLEVNSGQLDIDGDSSITDADDGFVSDGDSNTVYQVVDGTLYDLTGSTPAEDATFRGYQIAGGIVKDFSDPPLDVDNALGDYLSGTIASLAPGESVTINAQADIPNDFLFPEVGAPSGSGALGSNFEIDGNLVGDGDDTIDWGDFVNGDPTFNGNPQNKPDKPIGQDDDSLGKGSKEDSDPPSIVDGSIPSNKSDLTNFLFYAEAVDGNVFLNAAFIRDNTLGTANVDFELNQNEIYSPGE